MKLSLDPEHVSKRLAFARNHRTWTADDCHRVIFSDEVGVTLHPLPRLRVWRKPGEGLQPQFLQTYRSIQQPVLKFCGSFSVHGPGSLVRIPAGESSSQTYADILRDTLIEASELFGMENFIFLEDGDTVHHGEIVQRWKDANSIRLMKTPPWSPDCNPTEHIWAVWKRKIRARHAESILDLERICFEEWNSITRETCRSIIDSMPRRMEAIWRWKEATQNTKLIKTYIPLICFFPCWLTGGSLQIIRSPKLPPIHRSPKPEDLYSTLARCSYSPEQKAPYSTGQRSSLFNRSTKLHYQTSFIQLY